MSCVITSLQMSKQRVRHAHVTAMHEVQDFLSARFPGSVFFFNAACAFFEFCHEFFAADIGATAFTEGIHWVNRVVFISLFFFLGLFFSCSFFLGFCQILSLFFSSWFFFSLLFNDRLFNDGFFNDRLLSNWLLSNWLLSNWLFSNWLFSNWLFSNWLFSNWLLSNWLLSNWLFSNWLF